MHRLHCHHADVIDATDALDRAADAVGEVAAVSCPDLGAGSDYVYYVGNDWK